MTHFQFYRSGALFGIRYRFEAGESLPAHVHDATSVHNTIVLKGSCDFVEEGRTVRLSAGEVFDFDGTVRHRIVANEPCEILNLFLNGEPEGYDTLPAEGVM
ncbi:MAG TPA: cupin domain-containing protein [Candidatus Acidoferrales bacterium]|nr:cupin domain-containing protein [Candidatus Acidoferrales bacterium]